MGACAERKALPEFVCSLLNSCCWMLFTKAVPALLHLPSAPPLSWPATVLRPTPVAVTAQSPLPPGPGRHAAVPHSPLSALHTPPLPAQVTTLLLLVLFWPGHNAKVQEQLTLLGQDVVRLLHYIR